MMQDRGHAQIDIWYYLGKSEQVVVEFANIDKHSMLKSEYTLAAVITDSCANICSGQYGLILRLCLSCRGKARQSMGLSGQQ